MTPLFWAIIILCVVTLLALLVFAGWAGKFTARRLVVIAMLTAVHLVLTLTLTVNLGWMRITFNGLPIILAGLLYGPVGGMVTGILGRFLSDLLTYGITVTTPLWVLPAAVRGLIVGYVAKRMNYSLTKGQMTILIVMSSLIVTTLNTGAIYLDSVIYGYYTYAYVFGAIGTRYVSGIATAIVLALITPPLLRPLERALRHTRRE